MGMNPVSEQLCINNTPNKRPGLPGPPAWRIWCGAVGAAAAINIVFFMLMPYLLHQAPVKPQFDELVSQIQVVRLKRPERPAERKTKPPPPKNQEQRPRPNLTQTLTQQPTWPFEINSRLPGGPQSLSLPAMDTAFNLGDLFGVADLDQPLITLTRMPPVYPLSAKRRGIEGWVNVRFIVNEQGMVEEITILESEPAGLFDENVRRCVSGWRFKPGTVDGQSVRVWAETTIRFELD